MNDVKVSGRTGTTIKATDRYAEAEEKVKDAWAMASRAESAITSAEQTATHLRMRLRQGDDTVTAADLAAAAFAKERAELLAQAAKRNAQVVERKALVRPDLAELLAPTISQALSGLEVVVVDEFPAFPQDTPLVPTIYVRQTKRSQHNAVEGFVSGALEVAYERGKLHARPFWDDLTDALSADGHSAGEAYSRASDSEGDVVRDLAEVDVRRAFPKVPAIQPAANVTGWTANGFAAAMAGVASKTVHGINTVQENVGAHRQVKGQTVTTTVTGTLAAVSGKGFVHGANDLIRALKAGMDAAEGRAFMGLGRCQSVEAGEVSVGNGSRGLNFVAEFTARAA